MAAPNIPKGSIPGSTLSAPLTGRAFAMMVDMCDDDELGVKLMDALT